MFLCMHTNPNTLERFFLSVHAFFSCHSGRAVPIRRNVHIIPEFCSCVKTHSRNSSPIHGNDDFLHANCIAYLDLVSFGAYTNTKN